MEIGSKRRGPLLDDLRLILSPHRNPEDRHREMWNWFNGRTEVEKDELITPVLLLSDEMQKGITIVDNSKNITVNAQNAANIGIDSAFEKTIAKLNSDVENATEMSRELRDVFKSMFETISESTIAPVDKQDLVDELTKVVKELKTGKPSSDRISRLFNTITSISASVPALASAVQTVIGMLKMQGLTA